MTKKALEYVAVELGGVTYAMIREAQLVALCKRAGVAATRQPPNVSEPVGALEGEPATLATRIRQRRRAAGMTQAALADRAGIRTETLNRIECGKTEPDYRTIRKLVAALKAAEAGA